MCESVPEVRTPDSPLVMVFEEISETSVGGPLRGAPALLLPESTARPGTAGRALQDYKLFLQKPLLAGTHVICRPESRRDDRAFDFV